VIRSLGRRGRNAGRREKDNGESGTEKERYLFCFAPVCCSVQLNESHQSLSASLSLSLEIMVRFKSSHR
jgi:hypothetical protein